MSFKKYALVGAILVLALSSCTMKYPQSAAATPKPTNPFTNPIPTGSEPMAQVEGFATGTAMAKTAIAAGGPSATPSNTPIGGVVTTATNTPIGGVIATSTSTPISVVIATSTNTPISGSTNIPTSTPVPVTGRPATYTLQTGEHPWCIARRYDVDPYDLLALSGLTVDQGYNLVAGTVLRIPQSGYFPGDRALRPHPTTYTVASSDETFYSIACLFGDIDPAQIAQANGLTLGSILTIGQAIKIP